MNWTPPVPDAAVRHDCVYFGRALSEVDERMSDAGLRVFMTWDVEALPAYGDDVVAVVIGDEESRLPLYADRVRAIFKCYGSTPFAGLNPLRDRSLVSVLVTVETLRRWRRQLPGVRLRVAASVRRRRLAPLDPIPLGFYNQVELPLTPFDERPVAVHFAGSTGFEERRRLDPRRWLRRPHPVARREMLDALASFAGAHPPLAVDTTETPGFLSHKRDDAHAYSERLMRAKIVLSPRGGSVETYRYFEALRAGCVVICEPQPPTWFYRGSPAVTIRRWRDLPGVLEELLGDPAALRQRHRASLEWWRTRCSEHALAEFMVSRLGGDSPA